MMRNSGVRLHEPFEEKWEKFEQHENYILSSARAYSRRRRVPNAIRPHSQNCYNNSRPITLEIFQPYMYVPPQSVGFLRRFGMKTLNGHRFCPCIIGWNRMWFTKELRLCINVFVVSIPNE